jgi:hypothetical protein
MLMQMTSSWLHLVKHIVMCRAIVEEVEGVGSGWLVLDSLSHSLLVLLVLLPLLLLLLGSGGDLLDDLEHLVVVLALGAVVVFEVLVVRVSRRGGLREGLPRQVEPELLQLLSLSLRILPPK